MKKLYIDFDGVIMNTIEISYNNMLNLKIDQTDQNAIRNYYKYLNWHELLESANIINDAFNCIQKIRNSGKFEISILSHVNSLDEIVAKITYIRKFLPDITFISVPRSISKTDMVDPKNSILIDDYAGNLEEWKSLGGVSIRFNLELKGKGFIVVNKLDQILEVI